MKIDTTTALIGAIFLLSSCGGSSSMEPTAATNPATSIPVLPKAGPLSKWVPKVTDTWQWQLHGSINTAYPVSVFDVDLFDAPQATIDGFKSQGRRVVCYFSAGSSENFRVDFKQFLPKDLGNTLAGYDNERWLDTRSANVRELMKTRLDLAMAKGCDGVEPDNVDGYDNNPGFPLTPATQLDFNSFLAAEAHVRGLAIGLKNDIQQISALLPIFDFAVNEQCFEKNECATYAAFVASGKPVFNAEYAPRYQDNLGGARDTLCKASRSAGFHTLVLPLLLDDSSRYSCDQ
ncbi:hypothetical protein RCH09_003907 [Actimicrobium sp. GrIS 1.19]|uniref:endo alpha-1,4 polygalactosaminidase n=1 Tax=Actimicrobium sp. GrIS 1.19 TaxID=3071708 RepID=UPI002E0167E7|nr:hypothetical protein [Actimicrobium sp. GrIS 1.19]